MPATIAAVVDNYGHKVYYRDNKWQALGADGGYYECKTPEFWAYMPQLPRPA